MLTPIPTPLWAWLTFLAQAVPNRSALTFLELLLGAMITDRGFVTEALLAITPRRKWPTKARFSLIREPVGDDENAGCCQQRIDDVRQSVVATVEALVGEQPSIGVLDNAANGAQPGAVRLAALADQQQDALSLAKPAVLGAV